LDILRHDGNTLGVNGTQVGILEKTDQVSLSSFLKGQDSSRLETKIRLEILSDFTDKTLEWCLTDQEISRLLVLADFTKSDGSGTITVRLLDSTSSWGRFTGSLVKVVKCEVNIICGKRKEVSFIRVACAPRDKIVIFQELFKIAQ
jgi:hypothetical protein